MTSVTPEWLSRLTLVRIKRLSVSVSALERFRNNQTNTQSGVELQTNVRLVIKINYYFEMHGVSLNVQVFMKSFVS